MEGLPSTTTSGHDTRKTGGKSISLPVSVVDRTTVRPSRMSRRRATVLILVHVLIIAHILHWVATGNTLSPLEPSEAMYTLNRGHLNAGFLLLVAAILSTALFGRFFCGWACHLVAYQDLCAWLLKKVGIHPKPLRSRILVFAPLALALYMFVWPTVWRVWIGASAPAISNHLLKNDFWETFPGPIVAVLTFLVCGFAIVYFLGGKGFCTYACPYGGLFAPVDRIAPRRIVVDDSCEHCGHCTAACTSNVRVHEEVALYGMVVDPGCMKCMDCVSVCPNDALHFGLARPAIGAKPSAPRRPIPYDFSWTEEFSMALVAIVVILSWRGLYDQVPLLLTMGIAVIAAFLWAKSLRMFLSANVRLQNLQLKRGGSITRVGAVFLSACALLLACTLHSGGVQYSAWRGRAVLASLSLGDEVWASDNSWVEHAHEVNRKKLTLAGGHLHRADRWGLMPTRAVLHDLVWTCLAENRDVEAEEYVRRLLSLDTENADVRRSLAVVLRKQDRLEEAIAEYNLVLEDDSNNPLVHNELASLLLSMSRYDEAKRSIESWLAVESTSAKALALLGVACLRLEEVDEGTRHLRRAIELDSTLPEAHYNLGVATFMAGRIEDAIPHIRESIRLQPGDAVARDFLAMLLETLGDTSDPPSPHGAGP